MSLSTSPPCFLLQLLTPEGLRAGAAALATSHLRTLFNEGVRDLWTMYYWRFHQDEEIARCLACWTESLRARLRELGGLPALGKFIEQTDLALRNNGMLTVQAYWAAFLRVIEGIARRRAKENKKVTAEWRRMLLPEPVYDKPSEYVALWAQQAILPLKNAVYWPSLQEDLGDSPLVSLVKSLDWAKLPQKRPLFMPVPGCKLDGRWGGFLEYVAHHALPQYAEWVVCLLGELRKRLPDYKLRTSRNFALHEQCAHWLRDKFKDHASSEPIPPYQLPSFSSLCFRDLAHIPSELREKVAPTEKMSDEWRFLIFSARYGYARNTLNAGTDLARDWGPEGPPAWLIAARAHARRVDHEFRTRRRSQPAAATSSSHTQNDEEDKKLPPKKRKRELPRWSGGKRRPGNRLVRPDE